MHEYAPAPIPAVHSFVYVPDTVPYCINLSGSSPPVSVTVPFPVAVVVVILVVEFVVTAGSPILVVKFVSLPY